VQLVVPAAVERHVLVFAQEHPLPRILVHQRPQHAQHFVQARLLELEAQQARVVLGRQRVRVEEVVGRQGQRVVRQVGCSNSVAMASSRKPSTPRSSQKRTAAHMASLTAGLRQLRSGCSGRKA
jgi:hypothetical protein